MGEMLVDVQAVSASPAQYHCWAGRVVLGTDYPFDMGVADPLARLDQAGLDEADRELVRGANAAALLGL